MSGTDQPGGNQPSGKPSPEHLELRARPRPVTRINRKVVILITGTGALLLLGAAIFALDPPQLFQDDATGPELVGSLTRSAPDGLEALPQSYGDIPQPDMRPGPQQVGAGGPVPSDIDLILGGPPAPLILPIDPTDQAMRSERIRQERRAQQGREASVFFQLNRTPGARDTSEETQASAPSQVWQDRRLQNPFAVTEGAAEPMLIDRQNDPNLQGRKLAFLEAASDAEIYNPFDLQTPASPYQIMAGSVIAASLITGINSDLPGQITAQITQNVYDSVTGQHLLIPQGARVIGSYDSLIAYGQERALIIWHRIILPDGSSIRIDNLPATDAGGYAGLSDRVDVHGGRLLKGIALATLLGVSAELAEDGADGADDLAAALQRSAQDNASQIGQQLTARSLDTQPTLTIRPGWPLRIFVTRDLILRPYGGEQR